MADITEILRVVVDVAAERNAALRELDAVRAQLQADDQRAWETLGKPAGTYETTNVQRLCAEVERMRADMREAVELLRELGRPDHGDDLDARYVAFLTKHKETNQ